MSLLEISKRTISQSRYERGQTLIFTLAFAAATALVVLLLFNSGMLANAKTRLQNAADAGAYSAGVLQARDHNFSAYTNRAMVANQVAVVQLVSLKSYLEDAADTHDRMGGAILSLEELIPTSTTAWDFGKNLPIENVNSVFAAIAPIAVQGLDLLIQAFEKAQEAHHVATALDMVLVADEVVKRNDIDAKVTTGGFTVGKTAFQVKDWSNSTKQHSANDSSSEADRFADVVVSENSTDLFTRNRFSVPVPMWASTVNLCTMLPNYVSSFTFFGFTHAGGSILSEDKKRWLSLDATMGTGFQTCTVWYPCFPSGICYATETTPLIDGNFGLGGSGGGLAGASGDYNESSGYKNNPFSTKLYGGALITPPPMVPGLIRYSITGPGSTLDSSGGLQNYYRDMTDPLGSIPKDQTPEENGGKYTITIEVEHPGAAIRTASKFLPASTIVKLDDGLKSNTMRTLSSSHAYFYRSKTDDLKNFTRNGWHRDDDKAELANLFNPYWQTRLVDRTLAERTLSWAAQ
ncbi:hypothetical protein AAKU64_004202 [Undibacterium sp. GrIS 1.8]